MTPLLFLDCETSGLDPDRHEVWEVALIRRTDEGDTTYLWQLPVDLGRADPVALTIARFYERRWHPWSSEDPAGVLTGRHRVVVEPGGMMEAWAGTFSRLTHGGVFVAANPTFDAAFLGPLLRRHGACPGWHYRLVCVESLAVGWLAHMGSPVPVPWKGISDLAERLAIEVPEETKHSALADAEKVRSVYDRVMGDA